MNCRDCHDLLQQRLDGAAAGDPAALAGHLKDCPDCAALAAAARRLADGLRRLTPPAPPPELAGRIVGRVVQDRRARRNKRRRWASAGTFAVAASLLVAIGLRAWRPGPQVAPPRPAPPEVARVEPAPPEADTIRESVAQARSAVAALTSRTADEAVAQARALLPDLGRPSLNEIDLTPPLEAPAAPLREAGESVSAGLEPVANFSRRAVGQFLRDLSPMGVGTERMKDEG